MSKQDEYRQYAGECIASAKTATDDATRKQVLDLAKQWMTAAQQMYDGAAMPVPTATDSHKSRYLHRIFTGRGQ